MFGRSAQIAPHTDPLPPTKPVPTQHLTPATGAGEDHPPLTTSRSDNALVPVRNDAAINGRFTARAAAAAGADVQGGDGSSPASDAAVNRRAHTLAGWDKTVVTAVAPTGGSGSGGEAELQNTEDRARRPSPGRTQEPVTTTLRMSTAEARKSAHGGYACSDVVESRGGLTIELLLDTNEKMADGWEDTYIERLVVDPRRDHELTTMTEEAIELLRGVPGLSTRAKVLALYVSNRMGGSQRKDVLSDLNIVNSCRSVIKCLHRKPSLSPPATPPTHSSGSSFTSTSADTHTTTATPLTLEMEREVEDIDISFPSTIVRQSPATEILLGSVTHGLCRHRSLLFKYLCDVEGVDIPCRLYRNIDDATREEIRVWNSIPIAPRLDGKDYEWVVVALMFNPARLLPLDSEAAQHYLRRELIPESVVVKTAHVGLTKRRYMPPIDFEDPHHSIIREKMLGGGSFGKVYQCSLAGYSFALKEVPVRYSDDQDMNFKIKELQVLKRIVHPNITIFLGFQHVEDPEQGRTMLHIFMELAHETLDSYLLREHRRTMRWDDNARRKNHLSTSKFTCIVAQVLKGLAYIHGQSPPIIHRDIKPLNVLVFNRDGDSTPTLKLTDFGVSGEVNEDNIRHTKAGSPFFIAPEVEDGKPYDVAADIYSFGVLCAVCIALESPWHMDAQMLADVIADFYPKKIHNMMVDCLQEDPNKRSTAQQFLELVQSWEETAP